MSVRLRLSDQLECAYQFCDSLLREFMASCCSVPGVQCILVEQGKYFTVCTVVLSGESRCRDDGTYFQIGGVPSIRLESLSPVRPIHVPFEEVIELRVSVKCRLTIPVQAITPYQ